MTDLDTSRISPTAHYTGYVWCRNGLSPPELATHTGRLMFMALQGPMLAASLATDGVTLERLLLARHLIIDHVLDQAIEAGRIGQVLEVAAGLSGRGHRLTRRHRDLIYVEGDLPGMVERKRRMLAQLGARHSQHHVVALNALAEDGSESIFEVASALLDADRGTAIVTEGLLSYFPTDAVRGMWSRFAKLTSQHRCGLYVCDYHFADEFHNSPLIRTFRALLRVVARGEVHLHFEQLAELEAALSEAGLGEVTLHRPSELAARLKLPPGVAGAQVSIIEAWTMG